ncbi:MAG: Uma2 family endonuclease [Chloroflexi bacterium]|nr:Uma2 family endonuclease [Chloroflexota bacterium]
MDNLTLAIAPHQQIEYPESDGKPMAETDVHINSIIYLREALKDYFRDDPNVYIAGNLLIYYEEGNPSASVAPDIFVVRDVPKKERRTYKLWVESHPPDVVIEITSRSTRLEDLGNKRALYAILGVREYFLHDPLAEYLDPPLQGYQLVKDDYKHLEPAQGGSLTSQVLGLTLRIEAGQLRLVNPVTGSHLLTPAEAQNLARTEAEARHAAEQRAVEAEAELARLRAELTQLRGENPTES